MVCDKHVIAKDLLEKNKQLITWDSLVKKKKNKRIFSIQVQVSNLTSIRSPRENNETKGKSEGVGRDTWSSLKLFLEVVIKRKSNSCDVRTF